MTDAEYRERLEVLLGLRLTPEQARGYDLWLRQWLPSW